MFGSNMSYVPPAPVSVGDSHTYRLHAARDAFRNAQSRGSLHRVFASLLRRPTALKRLSSVVGEGRVTGRHPAGRREVPLNRICGSEGRSRDFDRFFSPLGGECRQRWISVLLARWMDVPLEPVQLIQIGDDYFVRDGHHRISVARALGETCIDAEVTVWSLAGATPSVPERSRAARRTRPALKSEG